MEIVKDKYILAITEGEREVERPITYSSESFAAAALEFVQSLYYHRNEISVTLTTVKG